MTDSNLKTRAIYCSIALATALATLLAVRARAAGIPDADVLTYTGYLEDADGQPLTTELSSIGLEVWDAADAGERVCDTSVEGVTPNAGRFQLVLPPECVAAVKATPNLWIDVKVEGASLGRTKLGAVPYAVEAGHATNADEATHAGTASDADGDLAARLSKLESAPSTVQASAAEVLALPLSSDGKYTPAYVDLTKGSWLVFGQALLTVTNVADAVRLALWNETAGAVVPLSGGAATDCQANVPCGVTSASTLLKVTTTTRIYLYGRRNGASALRFGFPVVGGFTATTVADTMKLTAVRLGD